MSLRPQSPIVLTPFRTAQHARGLSEVLRREDTVLFIGSGLSVWSGLPTWAEFIEDLSAFLERLGISAALVRAEAKRGDLLQAASYGFHRLTTHQIGEFVRLACRYGVAKPQEIHRKVVSLGPRCFVTTNYDNLIEESLRIWKPGRFYRPAVTNRQLAEMANVVDARALDFVFKPHGDAGDTESIILTREQYRQLLPGGERSSALESVKVILATKPVVYLGFGLRDPDFLYVRDLLWNTYKGGTRDHYAIVADISEVEADYWRSNYGVHLVPYTTTERPDGSRDHAELLALLDDLIGRTSAEWPPDSGTAESCSPEMILSLTRHAARLVRAPKVSPELPIRVRRGRQQRGESAYWLDKFDYCPVADLFLPGGPQKALVIGPPGAGKTYALLRAAAQLAEALHEQCISEEFNAKDVTVPLFADLKLYRGDLHGLIDSTLPIALNLAELGKRFKVKVFLDGFNEMPREHWENASYEADFLDFIRENANCSIIIGSRTTDGLSKLGCPVYSLDEIDLEFLERELERLQIRVQEGRFGRDILRLLQKPFYFHLVTRGKVKLPAAPHPADLYRNFFDGLDRAFAERFRVRFKLEAALRASAYDAINSGEEAQPLTALLNSLRAELDAAGIEQISPEDVANWLVAASVLIPYSGGRVALFHQSATEFLAASELARYFQASRSILREKLALTRWDQALLLTLSLLPEAESTAFLQILLEIDFALAIRATKYLEFGRDEITGKLLAELIERSGGHFRMGDNHRILHAIELDMAISDVHEAQLRALMQRGDSMGAAAVHRVVELKGGAAVKDELLQALIEQRSDFNYCHNGIAEALLGLATPEDVDKVAELADSIAHEFTPETHEEHAHGFISGAAKFLSTLSTDVVRERLLDVDDGRLSEVRVRVLCEYLWTQSASSALDLAGELLLRGIDRAATSLYFISSTHSETEQLTWTGYSTRHAIRLVSLVKGANSWALGALKSLCMARPDIAQWVRSAASRESGLIKVALIYAASETEVEPLAWLRAMLENNADPKLPVDSPELLKHMRLNWAGNEDLFVILLRNRDANLATALIQSIDIPYQPALRLEIGEILWWLEWLSDASSGWLLYRISWVFANCLSVDKRREFVEEFNRPESKYRKLLAHHILPRFVDLRTDEFSEDAISFLLADLRRGVYNDPLEPHLLGVAATEQCVKNRLLPLLPDATGRFWENLRAVLSAAGARHGARYVSE